MRCSATIPHEQAVDPFLRVHEPTIRVVLIEAALKLRVFIVLPSLSRSKPGSSARPFWIAAPRRMMLGQHERKLAPVLALEKVAECEELHRAGHTRRHSSNRRSRARDTRGCHTVRLTTTCAYLAKSN
jgi:hypothetical protein